MRLVHAAVAALVLLPAALAAADRVPRPRVEVDKSTTCVLPAAEMRREHPNLLKHRRDRTVHEGVRGGGNALAACIDCHAGKAGGDVAGGPDAFCQSCHTYAAVKLDCFECHQSRRERKVATGGDGGATR